ncbi:hypothetical protein ACFV0C_24860 [Streptomyces sp. NPDC059568]|uniref:hypothetical protein n=1 Tax=Streptomyces sp. NPDC059568 TaxID=3346868 RepID=UPI00369AF630
MAAQALRARAGRAGAGAVCRGLIARVCDLGDVAEVRIALLDLLAGRAELLPWLKQEDRQHERSYGVPEAILKARGMLGDRSAARELATLAASPWPRWRAVGGAGLDALVTRYGVEAVLVGRGDVRPEDRVFGVRMRHRSGADVTEALADPDRGVAHLTQSLLSDPYRLRGYLGEAPTTEAKLWTAYAPHRLTGDTAETRAIYDTQGRAPGEQLSRVVGMAFLLGCGDLGCCEAGFLVDVRVGVVEEGLDQWLGPRVMRGAENVDGVCEDFAFHRRHGRGQRFYKIQGEAVVVGRLADRVQGGLADLGHGFVDGQADEASDDQTGGIRVERGAAQEIPEHRGGDVSLVRIAVGQRFKCRERLLHAAPASDRSAGRGSRTGPRREPGGPGGLR